MRLIEKESRCLIPHFALLPFHAEAGSYDRPRLLKQSASPARSPVRRVLIVPSLRGQNDHDEHRKDH